MNVYIKSKNKYTNEICKQLSELQEAMYRQFMTQPTTVQMHAEKEQKN